MFLKNVKIINHNQTINNADIEIENNIIKSIIVKKGEGKAIVIPGFIDLHTHGFDGYDVMDNKKAVQKISQALSQFGVTSFLPTVMTNDLNKLNESMKIISTTKVKGSKILGIHMEGPFFGLEKKGAQNEKYLMDGSISVLHNFQKSANGIIKKISFDPDRCDDSLIKELIKMNIVATQGHSNTSFERATQAIDLGVTSCTHLWNGMSGVDHKRPGMAQAVLMNSKTYAELICDFIHIKPETIKFTINNKGVDKITCITDSIRPAGLKDGSYESGGQKVNKKGLLITLKSTGNIAGSGATMHGNFKNLLSLGYSINDVVKMTSYNASQNMNFKNVAEIKKGYFADLIILDKNNNIKNVYVNGKKVKK